MLMDETPLNYIFQDDTNTAGLRIIDLCYTAFMRAKDKNDEDGGPTDWFTDTRPLIIEGIDKLRTQVDVETTDEHVKLANAFFKTLYELEDQVRDNDFIRRPLHEQLEIRKNISLLRGIVASTYLKIHGKVYDKAIVYGKAAVTVYDENGNKKS